MVRWVVGSIPHGGPIALFLVPTGVTKTVVCAYKITVAANRKE